MLFNSHSTTTESLRLRVEDVRSVANEHVVLHVHWLFGCLMVLLCSDMAVRALGARA